MLKIVTATPIHLKIINKLANQIWWHTYGNFISEQQIAFMLNDMYSLSSLKSQMANNHIFKMAFYKNKYCGFASYSKTVKVGHYKIHKLYLNQNVQGLGLGKFFLLAIENELTALGAVEIKLNVNRENKAQFFYLKMGYKILQTINIPYHNFILNDFVMGKNINPI